MGTDVVQSLEPKPPWQQQALEPDFEYAWFVKYAELGEQRTLEKVSAFQGVPLDLVQRARDRHEWDARVAAYDATLVDVMQHVQVSEDEALAMQYAVGMAMMRLGVSAVALKNPALIKMKDVQLLMAQGAEMARRGAGVADLNVQHDVVTRVRDQVLDLLD